jgi:hypothetical protein
MLSKLKMWRTETRPSVDAPFWEASQQVKDYYKTTYVDTNLLLNSEILYSDDQLTKTRTTYWAMVPGIIDTLSNDATINQLAVENADHNAIHGIIRSSLHYEIYDQDDKLFSSGVFPQK